MSRQVRLFMVCPKLRVYRKSKFMYCDNAGVVIYVPQRPNFNQNFTTDDRTDTDCINYPPRGAE